MTDNNGWNGVPLNPEEERHHWILTSDGEYAVYLWRPAGECERGRWPSAWVYDVDDWDPREGTYLGPCLTPAEVDARVKEAVDLGKDITTRELDPQIAMLIPWQTALEDALSNWCDAVADDETPKDALQRLIRLEVMAALDPAVSKSAADLVAAARKEWLAELKHDTDALMEAARQSALAECIAACDAVIR
jgi:hypothetical protein